MTPIVIKRGGILDGRNARQHQTSLLRLGRGTGTA